jgi:hypothetical protein
MARKYPELRIIVSMVEINIRKISDGLRYSGNG